MPNAAGKILARMVGHTEGSFNLGVYTPDYNVKCVAVRSAVGVLQIDLDEAIADDEMDIFVTTDAGSPRIISLVAGTTTRKLVTFYDLVTGGVLDPNSASVTIQHWI